MNCRYTAILAMAMFCAFSATVPAQADVYTIQPDEAASKDTFVYQYLADQNLEFGNYTKILGASKTTTNPTGHDLNSLIQFDLNSLTIAGVPAGDVTSAKLRLYTTANTLGSADPPPKSGQHLEVSVSEIGSAWIEGNGTDGVTWNTIPSTVGGAVATAEVTGLGQWVEFNVTSLVQKWLNDPASNFGMLLTQDAEVTNDAGRRVAATFVASNGGADFRPMLQITTVPEPSGLFLLATAGWMALRFRKRR